MTDESPLLHSIEAETSVLGACLIRQEAIDEIRDLLDGDDFFRDAHRRIWRALCTVHDNGLAADLVTVRDHLAATDALDKVWRLELRVGPCRRRSPVDQRPALRPGGLRALRTTAPPPFGDGPGE